MVKFFNFLHEKIRGKDFKYEEKKKNALLALAIQRATVEKRITKFLNQELNKLRKEVRKT